MKPVPVFFAYPGDLDTPTGGYRYDRRLIQELRKLGISVEPLSLGPGFPAADPTARQRAEQALARLPEAATVIIDGLAFGVLDEAAQRLAGRLRLIALCHHPLGFESGLNSVQRDAFIRSERRALACAHAILVTSPYTAKLLGREFGVPPGKITVAVPGTDRSHFTQGNGQPPRLLTVGSLTRRKGHDVLIAALAGMRDVPWQARFVGSDAFDPDWAQRLQAEVQQQALTDRIHFTGEVDDPGAEYLQADLFVLPSRFEGYGMVFSEALAAGLPVIAANAGAVPDVVPETAGILVPPDDSTALRQALRDFLTDQRLRERLQAGARQAAAALPSWADTAATVARQLVEV